MDTADHGYSLKESERHAGDETLNASMRGVIAWPVWRWPIVRNRPRNWDAAAALAALASAGVDEADPRRWPFLRDAPAWSRSAWALWAHPIRERRAVRWYSAQSQCGLGTIWSLTPSHECSDGSVRPDRAVALAGRPAVGLRGVCSLNAISAAPLQARWWRISARSCTMPRNTRPSIIGIWRRSTNNSCRFGASHRHMA